MSYRLFTSVVVVGLLIVAALFLIASYVDNNRNDEERAFCESLNAERVDPPGLGSDFTCVKDGKVVYNGDE